MRPDDDDAHDLRMRCMREATSLAAPMRKGPNLHEEDHAMPRGDCGLDAAQRPVKEVEQLVAHKAQQGGEQGTGCNGVRPSVVLSAIGGVCAIGCATAARMVCRLCREKLQCCSVHSVAATAIACCNAAHGVG